MGAVGTAAVWVAAVVGVGIVIAGPVVRPDGSVDPGATIKQGAETVGPAVGDAVGKAADGIANGAASGAAQGVASSKTAQAAAAGVGVYGAYKGWQKWAGRIEGEPAAEPESDAGEAIVPQPAPAPDVTSEPVEPRPLAPGASGTPDGQRFEPAPAVTASWSGLDDNGGWVIPPVTICVPFVAGSGNC